MHGSKYTFPAVRLFCLCAAAVLFLTAAGCSKGPGAGDADKGRLLVESDPAGASIHIRGVELKNPTPFERGLKTGTYLVRVEKFGYRPRWERVVVEKNKTTKLNVSLEPMTASVLVTSEPSGAMVSMDGRELGPTPYILPNLPFNTYEITVTLNNYKPLTQKFVVPLEPDYAPDSPFEVKCKLLSDTGSLTVTTDPEGAEVYIDGERSASLTPANIPKLQEGDHKVKVVKKGYRAVESTVTIVRDKTTNVPVFKLEQLPGILKLAVTPEDAQIEINGERFSDWGKERELAPGVYKIRTFRDGYNDDTREVKIMAEEKILEKIALTKNTGILQLVVIPEDASVEINGDPVSDWNKEREILAGTYTVSVSRNGFDPVTRKVKIAAEQKTTEKIILTQNTGEVRFMVNPSGVSISIDGRLVGMSQPADAARPEESQTFRIAGLSVGEHTLRFMHPRAKSSVVKKFRIESKGETKTLEKIDMWIPNANVEVLKTKRIYKEGRIIPTGEKSDEVLYEPVPGVRDTYRKSEIRITELKQGPVSDPRFKTSYVNLLNFDEKPGAAVPASVRFNGLPAGSEILINGTSRGKVAADNAPFIVSDLKAGTYTIQIAHKYGRNTRNPDSNSVRITVPLTEGETKVFSAPPIFWVANADLHLKDGNRYLKCRIVREAGTNLVVETEPGKQINVKKSDVLKNIPLKD